MKFTVQMEIVFEVSEKLMDESGLDFSKAVLNGDIKVGDAGFKVLDPDGEILDIDLEDTELGDIGDFMQNALLSKVNGEA